MVTMVSAHVDEGRGQELVAAFDALLHDPLPDGLLRTQLLGDGNGTWVISSTWRDREALDAMRAAPEPPAAPALFRRFGAEPTLVVMRLLTDSSE